MKIHILKPLRDWLVIVPILLLAAYLRLNEIAGYMTFLGDEGRDVLIVYEMLHGDFTFLGPTSSAGGFFYGPAYYYFMTPFLWLFNYNPVGPAVMVALFGIATVWLVYRVGSIFFGRFAGFIAALLYAISPLVIGYSRSSWNPNPLPFFSLLSLFLIYKAVATNKRILFIIVGILLGISIQLHYLALLLITVIGVYVFATGLYLLRKLAIKNKIGYFLHVIKDILLKYLFIFIGFVIGWSPFLAFEVKHGFPNLHSIFRFLIGSGDTGGNSEFLQTVWEVFFRLFGRFLTTFPLPEQVSIQDSLWTFDFFIVRFTVNIGFLYYPTLILALLSTGLLLFQYIRSRKQKEKFLQYSVIFFWLFIGVFLFGFYKKAIYDYHFGFLFPLPFLLVGNFISQLFFHLTEGIAHLVKIKLNGLLISNTGKVLAVFLVMVLFLLNISGMPFRHPPNHQLAQVKKIARFVYKKTDGKPYNFALVTQGNSDHSYRYFFTLWGHTPITIENDQIDPQRKTVTDQLLIICEQNPCAPLGHPLWEIAGFGPAEIAGEWDISVLKVYKLIHYTEKK